MLAARLNALATVKLLLTHPDIDVTLKTFSMKDIYSFAAEMTCSAFDNVDTGS